MYLIKPCPTCGKKLRFPINKGKVVVKCVCGNSFIADPDDSLLYEGGNFDLKPPKKNKQKKHEAKYLKKNLIEKIYSIKYKLQNYKILPAAEQKKIISILIIIASLIAILAVIIFSFSAFSTAKNNSLVI